MIDLDSRKAVLAMLAAGALVAATSVLAKWLGLDTGQTEVLHPLQITAGRYGFALLTLTMVLTVRPRLRPNFVDVHWSWHVMRTACGWAGVTCLFAAVVFMPVAEATAISFLSPLITMALSVAYLGEAMTLRKAIAICCALIGGFLILQPDAEGLRPAGLLALAAAVFMGIEAIFIKKLADSEPALRILLISNTIGTVIALSVASFVFVAPTATQWIALCALGTIMVTGQAFFIQSMKHGDASFVIPVFYSVLAFAALYDLVIFDVVPSAVALMGSGFIVVAALLLSLRRKPAAR